MAGLRVVVAGQELQPVNGLAGLGSDWPTWGASGRLEPLAAAWLAGLRDVLVGQESRKHWQGRRFEISAPREPKRAQEAPHAPKPETKLLM